MAELKITIPDNKVDDLLDAYCNTFGYDPASGETKIQFAKRIVVEGMKKVVHDYKTTAAVAAITVDEINLT